MKTTAPKFYCVRPNAAIVAPGETVQIQIIFLGLTEEPNVDFKCRDKFLVITLPAPYDLGDKNVADIWPDLESEFKDQAVSKKLKVKYLISNVAPEETTVASDEQEQLPSQSEPVKSEEIDKDELPTQVPTQENEIKKETEQINTNNQKTEKKEEIISPKVTQAKEETVNVEKEAVPATKTTSEQVKTTESSMNLVPFILVAIIAFILRWLYS